MKQNHVSALFFFLHGESRDGAEGDTESSGPVSPAGYRQRRPRLRKASALALPPAPSRLLGSGRGGLDRSSHARVRGRSGRPRRRPVTARTHSVGTGDGYGVEDVTRREAHDAEVA